MNEKNDISVVPDMGVMLFTSSVLVNISSLEPTREYFLGLVVNGRHTCMAMWCVRNSTKLGLVMISVCAVHAVILPEQPKAIWGTMTCVPLDVETLDKR